VSGRQKIAIFAVMLAASDFTMAYACIPPTLDTVREFSDVIVEGTFVVSDEAAGTGHIIPKRLEKGRRLRRYHVIWDPNEEESLQPHMRDCMVSIPESGTFETFWLAREDRRTFRIIGRGIRVKKGKY
jgi:hypothetical protein